MENWQKSRNYRLRKDEDGRVIGYIISIGVEDVDVTKEVYDAYSQADRRERYIAEEVEPGLVLSLDEMLEDHIPLEKLISSPEMELEQTIVDMDEANRMKRMLSEGLASLNDSERQLIQALFFDGVSAREYARMLGVSDMAVRKRRDRILKKLRKFFV